jgi:hypothetical protein
LWILNLATCGLGGVQMRFMGRIGWGYRSVSRGFRGSFIVILDWRLVMALQLDSGMMYGVGIRSSSQLCRSCSFWPIIRMLLQQII